VVALLLELNEQAGSDSRFPFGPVLGHSVSVNLGSWQKSRRVLLVLAVVAVAACSGGGRSAPQVTPENAKVPTTVPAATVTFSPAAGVTNVALDAPVVISVSSGRLASVSVVAGLKDKAPLAGQLDPTGTRWTSGATLAPATTYKVGVQVTEIDGRSSVTSSSFETMAPARRLTARVAPLNGTTVGVGQPIAVYLSAPVTDRAAVERLLTVTTDPPVAGSWLWLSSTQLHWRPPQYWEPKTKVTLDAALAGVDFGGGLWGTESRKVAFTIGDSHVSVVDAATHQMTVTTNGKLERTIPVSTGKDKDPTKSGVHVVMDKEQTTVMDSATVGIPAGSPDAYKLTVFWNVRISNSGEFVHAAPWSVGSQGKVNVSHGCVNLSPEQATWFFKYSQLGDVVEVKGTPVQLELTNGFGDWNVPFPTPA